MAGGFEAWSYWAGFIPSFAIIKTRGLLVC